MLFVISQPAKRLAQKIGRVDQAARPSPSAVISGWFSKQTGLLILPSPILMMAYLPGRVGLASKPIESASNGLLANVAGVLECGYATFSWIEQRCS
jgi:hypothetical protein